MKLRLVTVVPSSADRNAVLAALQAAADHRVGITITLASGYQVDVDLASVRRVD